jgi:hypothetical protein
MDDTPARLHSPVDLDALLPAARAYQARQGARAVMRDAMNRSGGKASPTAIREWLEQHGTTPDWGQEPWRRSGTDALCQTCGRMLLQHPDEYGPGYGSCGDEVLHLRRDCRGGLHHL